jgi:hypothetical protein
MLTKNSAILVITLFSVSGSAQRSVTDLKSLVGMKAIAQRIPLYEPGTYKAIPNTYAGQQVTIIAFKPMAMPKITLSSEQLARLNAQQRAAIQDAQNMGTLVVQFADGTKADTGAIMPSLLANYLELVEQPPPVSATGPDGAPERPQSATAARLEDTPENPLSTVPKPAVQPGPVADRQGEGPLGANSGYGPNGSIGEPSTCCYSLHA